MTRLACLLVLLSLPAVAGARGGSIIAAGGTWAAVLRDGRCDAQSRIVVTTPAGRASAVAGFGFAAGAGQWGTFHARLSRVPRLGATVIATIGTTQFLLGARGQSAWSRDSRQDRAMLDAIRSSSGMRIESRDRAGRRFTDHYSLDFAPTAIDAAAARCAALRTGQKR